MDARRTHWTDRLPGQRVTVMGLGRFGGGVGVTRWLARRGAQILVTDTAPREHLADSLQRIDDLVAQGTVTLRLGDHALRDFTHTDLVVANPAVPRPWDNPFLRAARSAGVPITTEIALAIDSLPPGARTIGVTGTAGKSTTSALVAHILNAAGVRAALGGNIGGSLLDDPDAAAHADWVVLELSSAQLHWIDAWSPTVAVLTGFAPNHLDWHGSVEHYRACKQRIFDHQRPGDAAVLAAPDLPFQPSPGVAVAEPWRHSPDPPRPLRLLGAHNAHNAAAAVAACAFAGIDPVHAWALAATFPGLPHRLEIVAEHDGVRFINDSKCTTPGGTRMALEAVAQHTPWDRIHLIAGGYDRSDDFTALAPMLWKLAGLYTIGATGATLAHLGGGTKCGTLDEAFRHAASRARPGDAVLLSPACASWDQFLNYQQRGDRFRALVHAHISA